MHPLILIPLLGQLLLVYTLFEKRPTKLYTFLGLGGIGMLFLFILVIGLIIYSSLKVNAKEVSQWDVQTEVFLERPIDYPTGDLR